MTKKQRLDKASELRATADRLDASLVPDARMSSQDWVSPERHVYVRGEANKLRQEASRLERLK